MSIAASSLCRFATQQGGKVPTIDMQQYRKMSKTAFTAEFRQSRGEHETVCKNL